VRHLISIPAGIARMPIPSFAALTVAGASIWGGGLMVLGYWLGENWEPVAQKAKRFDLVIAGLVVLGLIAIAARFFLKRKQAKQSGSDPGITT